MFIFIGQLRKNLNFENFGILPSRNHDYPIHLLTLFRLFPMCTSYSLIVYYINNITLFLKFPSFFLFVYSPLCSGLHTNLVLHIMHWIYSSVSQIIFLFHWIIFTSEEEKTTLIKVTSISSKMERNCSGCRCFAFLSFLFCFCLLLNSHKVKHTYCNDINFLSPSWQWKI